MPSRPKRQAPSNRVYTSEPNSRQVHFPSRKRSFNPTKPMPPTSRTRQQTLTQIDFVTKYVPQDEDVDLNYIEHKASPKRKRRKTLPNREAPTAVKQEEPLKRKRRKTLPAQVTATAMEENESLERRRGRTRPVKDMPTVETRTSKRRKIKQEPVSERNATSTTTEKQSNAARIHPSPAGSELNPPRTPVTARKVEIPSSQSPTDTPLSTQKTASFRSPVRSPLKARSTNARFLLTAGLKGRKVTDWHPKLEVKSSLSWENEDSQPLAVAPILGTVGQGEYELERSNSSNGLDSCQQENEGSKGALQGPVSATDPLSRPTPTLLPVNAPPFNQSSKTEIRDSDDEEEEEEDEDEETPSPHNTTTAAQPIEHDPSLLPHPLPSTSNQTNALKAAPTPNTDAPLLSPRHAHEEPSVSPQTPSSSDCEPKPNGRDDNTPTNRNTLSPIHPLLPPLSSAEAASAQLFNDLYRQTQTQLQPQHDEYTQGQDRPSTSTHRLLDSQSQFGFICRDYTPSPPPLSPIAAALPVPNEPEPNYSSRSRYHSPSPTNPPRTSQISTQSPLISRTFHPTTYPGPPLKQPHLQTSQISTQSQSQLPLKLSTLPAPPPQYPRQQNLSSRSISALRLGDFEFRLPPLPRLGADIQQEREQESGRSSPCPPDTDADILAPQTFLQSSPVLAPSLPSSPLLSRIHLQYGSQGEDEDPSRGEDATAEIRVEGEGDGWDGRIKTTSQFLPESMFDDESQNFGLGLPPGFSSQLLE